MSAEQIKTISNFDINEYQDYMKKWVLNYVELNSSSFDSEFIDYLKQNIDTFNVIKEDGYRASFSGSYSGKQNYNFRKVYQGTGSYSVSKTSDGYSIRENSQRLTEYDTRDISGGFSGEIEFSKNFVNESYCGSSEAYRAAKSMYGNEVHSINVDFVSVHNSPVSRISMFLKYKRQKISFTIIVGDNEPNLETMKYTYYKKNELSRIKLVSFAFFIPIINLILWFVAIKLSGNYMDANAIDIRNNRIMIYIIGSIVTIIINILLFCGVVIVKNKVKDKEKDNLKYILIGIIVIEVIFLLIFGLVINEYLGNGLILK